VDADGDVAAVDQNAPAETEIAQELAAPDPRPGQAEPATLGAGACLWWMPPIEEDR